MLPGNYPLKIYRGDTYHWQFKLWLNTDKTNPVDLTGVVAKSEIREKSGTAVIAELDCVISLPNIIDVTMPTSISSAFTMTALKWDLQLTYPNGEVNTIVAGDVTVILDITDSSAATVMMMEAAPMSRMSSFAEPQDTEMASFAEPQAAKVLQTTDPSEQKVSRVI